MDHAGPYTLPFPFGSNQWAAQAFATPPVRLPGGQSRRTHRFSVFVPDLDCDVVVEGKPEFVALKTLEFMKKIRLIRRFKPQPYYFGLPGEEERKVPDFLFERIVHDVPHLYALETLTERFYNRDEQRNQFLYAQHHEQHAVHYLLWTDKKPWTRAYKSNVLHMWRSAGEEIAESEVEGLLELFHNRRQWHLGEIYEKGFDMTLVEALAWSGALSFPLMDEVNENTVISAGPDLHFADLLFGATVVGDPWWASLPDA